MADLSEITDKNHVCFGHPCDACDLCLSGICCGSEVYEANLPEQGSWKGKHFVPLGQMHLDGEGKLVCHICGKGFHGLWKHLQTHGVTTEEYRAYFGLKCGEPLASPEVQEKRALAGGYSPEALEKMQAARVQFTAEQRSLWSKNRVARIGATGVGTNDGQQSARAAAWHVKRNENPELDIAWRKTIRARRRKLDDEGLAPVITCVVCKTQFCHLGSHGAGSPRKICGSSECKKEVKRRAQLKSAAARKAARKATKNE